MHILTLPSIEELQAVCSSATFRHHTSPGRAFFFEHIWRGTKLRVALLPTALTVESVSIQAYISDDPLVLKSLIEGD